jgi:flagellar biosynthetic protein FliO
LKRIALVLCAALALGTGAVAGAQGSSTLAQAATGSAVGTASSVDETTLSLNDSGANAKAAKTAAGSSTLAYFLRMIVVLALVLAAIYGVYRLMKKAAGPKVIESPAIKVLASSSLGTGKALHVVLVGAKGYLVGATDSQVSLVAAIDDKEYLDALVLEAEANPPPREGSGREFGKVLSSLMSGKGMSGKREAGKKRGEGDFLSGQRDRLRKF